MPSFTRTYKPLPTLLLLVTTTVLSGVALAAEDDFTELAYDDAGEFNFVRVQFDTYFTAAGFGYGSTPDFPMPILPSARRSPTHEYSCHE